ncbi:MAG: hydrolase [Ignavibacteriaceae bacterium]
MSQELKINIQSTSVVVIDLQRGIAAIPTEPHPADVVIKNSVRIVEAARENEMPVFLVHVTPSPDFKDALKPIADTSSNISKFDPSWSEYVAELNIQPNDFLITKHQWGAFYGTELDLQLRRRKIDTIILCGIATNFGVESTARFAYEFGYNQIFASDAMAARSKEEHDYPLKYIFSRLGLILNTEEILKAFWLNKIKKSGKS